MWADSALHHSDMLVPVVAAAAVVDGYKEVDMFAVSAGGGAAVVSVPGAAVVAAAAAAV